MVDHVSKESVPSHKELFNPVLNAIHELGESASNGEILSQVIKGLDLPNEVTAVPHGTDGRSELEYRLAWAKTYLKLYGLIENSARGVWSLTHTTQN